MKFKTNIKCSACVATVTPYLDDSIGEGKWEVDLNTPAKILTIAGKSDAAKIKEAVEKAGYKAEKI